jgi:hypothetical protein
MIKVVHKSKKKRRGRPAIGQIIALRLSELSVRQIMKWGKDRGLTRSQAIRRLIERGWGKNPDGPPD